MISFFSKADYSCNFSSTLSSSDGWGMIMPGKCTNDPTSQMLVRRMRAPTDFILTSKEVFFAGDRSCTHRQLDVSFLARPVTTGLAVRRASFAEYKASLLLGYKSPKWVQPANGQYFDKGECVARSYTYATAPVTPFMRGSDAQVEYVFLPGTNDSFDRAYTDGSNTTWKHFVFSSVHSRGITVCCMERFQLSKAYGATQWAYSDYNAWCRSSIWFPKMSVNTGVGLTDTGYDYWASVVPSKRYPGGVHPSMQRVQECMSNSPVDQFGFKAMLLDQLDASLVTHSGTDGYSLGCKPDVSEKVFRAQAELLTNIPEMARLQHDASTSEIEWADLADTCIDHCRAIDINGLAYVKEGVELIMEVISAIKQKRLPRPESIPDFWLSARYGLRLTAADTASIVDAAKGAIKSVARDFSVSRARKDTTVSFSSGFVRRVDKSLRYKLYYNRRDDPVLNVLRTIADWDLWPSSSNIWDLIPFSFVVDWFVDVQGQLEHIDNSQYQQFLTILSVLYTEKLTYTLNPDVFSSAAWVCQQAKMTFYRRRHSSSPHYAPLRLGGGHASNINWVDGAMLVLQKIK